MPSTAPHRTQVAASVLIAVLATAPLPFTVTAFIMGDDDRVPVAAVEPDPTFRQTGIVRVFGEELATGLVTGANCDVVVSAGHVLVAPRGNGPPDQAAADPAFVPGGPGSAAAIPMQLAASGGGTGDDFEDDARDWAIFRLRHPLPGGCQVIGPVTAGDHCVAGVMMPAFHFDRRDTLLVDRDCRVYPSVSSGVRIHDCDSKEGSSGAPLLCRTGGDGALVGINVSGLTRRGYTDPGIYGQRGEGFDPGSHKNYAVAVGGAFRAALERELAASRQRAQDSER